MSYPITRVVVKDVPPPHRPVMTVGRIYSIVENPEPETVFATVGTEKEADEKFVDEAETKVVKRRRRPQPQANEDAETK